MKKENESKSELEKETAQGKQGKQLIQAQVDKRLLAKADRLFTGTLEGRIIETLQNARRAGATRAEITNGENGWVTIQDNGRGIQDFSVLLNLSSSDWDTNIEEAEDPAWVGIFVLAPRDVVIESGSTKLEINQETWTGTPARLFETRGPVVGTRIQFKDSPWTFDTVQQVAVFTCMEVIVDGKACDRQSFCSSQATHFPDLGIRIEVKSWTEISEWHKNFLDNAIVDSAIVNFYGQIITFEFDPLIYESLCFLIDLTGEPTGLRLKLPARTRMVENGAFAKLEDILEIEAFRYIQQQSKHDVSYTDYLRAKQLGIELSEAKPTYTIGSLVCQDLKKITLPENFPLSQCYLMKDDTYEIDNENTHILAAFGKCDNPFIPVRIDPKYDGYSWTKLPIVKTVKVSAKKRLGSYSRWWVYTDVFENLEIMILTSDGKEFHSSVPVAIRKPNQNTDSWLDKTVCLTPEARDTISWKNLRSYCGSFIGDDDESFNSQLVRSEDSVDRFWADAFGPEEYLRDKLQSMAHDVISNWTVITLTKDGKMIIIYDNGINKSF